MGERKIKEMLWAPNSSSHDRRVDIYRVQRDWVAGRQKADAGGLGGACRSHVLGPTSKCVPVAINPLAPPPLSCSCAASLPCSLPPRHRHGGL